MASSEGITFRWEAFNRWCDEYADDHGGMKPKVEDVRKWHRENAEKVWLDSGERPSVFLAVSHNKGRRVRGHKTCEYYKRYRAGKVAEQQLAARLQHSALSGRRILAVTAAARKLNTECGRTGAKRCLPDDVEAPGSELLDDIGDQPGFLRARKHRRMRPFARHFSSASRLSTGVRRGSSDGLSEDASWASGAGTSRDDYDQEFADDAGSGAAATLPAAAARCFAPPALLSSEQQQTSKSRPMVHAYHAGVHITVVRRDADGRTIQVEAQPAKGGDMNFDFRQSPLPSASAYVLANHMLAEEVVAEGCSLRKPGCTSHDSGTDPSGGEGAPHGGHSVGGLSGGRSCAVRRSPGSGRRSLGAAESDNCTVGMYVHGPPQQQSREELGVVWAGRRHPGVAPRTCRRARCGGGSELFIPNPSLQLPKFSRYVPTPVGPVPVYSVTERCTCETAKRVRRTQRELGSVRVDGVTEGGVELARVARDPLDLLAEVACDALDSPRPAEGGFEGKAGEQSCLDKGKGMDTRDVVECSGMLSADAGQRRTTPPGLEVSGVCEGRWEGGSVDADRVAIRDQRKCRTVMLEHACAVKLTCGQRNKEAVPLLNCDTGPTGRACELNHQWPQHSMQEPPAAAAAGQEAEGLEATAPERIHVFSRVKAAVRTEAAGEFVQCKETAVELPLAPTSVNSGVEAAPTARLSAAPAPPECGDAATSRCRSVSGSGAEQRNNKLSKSLLPFLPSPSDAMATVLGPVMLFKPATVLSNAPDTCGRGSEAGPPCWLPSRVSAGGGGGGSIKSAATMAVGAPGRVPLCVDPSELEAELSKRTTAHVVAAHVAAVLLEGQLPLMQAPGLGHLSLAALGSLGAGLPCRLPLPPPAPASPPQLWPALPGGAHGSMIVGATVVGDTASVPLLTDASGFDGALVGTAVGAVSGTGGQLLPMMRLLQMQGAAQGAGHLSTCKY